MENKIKIANQLLLLLIFTFGVFSGSSLAARSDDSNTDKKHRETQQQIEVSGRVTDAQTGDPLPGVNIVIEGTTVGTTTDMDGEYTLEAPADATLVFSFIGYQEQTIEINGREEIDVAMQQAVTELEEVVAIGYGTQRRRDVTGSISSAQSEDLELDAVNSPDEAMQGKLSGVNVFAGS
ncbi:MAG: carboxypeptidase-like regulatory domain-containing protein, partial [Bacteroidales bacterium]|nr:carboxypeptidase-like regulatory domain-containing protein [Bacteroidales bacterium]